MSFQAIEKCPPVVIDVVVLFNCINRKRAVRKRKRKAHKGGG
jgi:hypothetical protein